MERIRAQDQLIDPWEQVATARLNLEPAMSKGTADGSGVARGT